MHNLKKEMARLTSKDEMTQRINTLFGNLNDKIQDRPTLEMFENRLANQDRNIESV